MLYITKRAGCTLEKAGRNPLALEIMFCKTRDLPETSPASIFSHLRNLEVLVSLKKATYQVHSNFTCFFFSYKLEIQLSNFLRAVDSIAQSPTSSTCWPLAPTGVVCPALVLTTGGCALGHALFLSCALLAYFIIELVSLFRKIIMIP